MQHFNDEMLFRRITADESTKTLIHEWMKNIQVYYNVKYRCFARILEATGMTGPFNLTHEGKTQSDTFRCEYFKESKRTSVSVFLRFSDGCDNSGEIWVNDKESGTRNIFIIKKGKIVPRNEA